MDYWQEKTLCELVSYLEPNKSVLALLVFGSCAEPESSFDYWSDIDLLLVLDNSALPDYFPSTAWLEQFGSIYAYDQSGNDYKSVTRVCFEDFRRLDLVFTTEDSLRKIEIWPRNPLTAGVRTVFSRSPVVDEFAGHLYEQKPFSNISDERFKEMVRDFRFKSMLAVYKVVRTDLLIALHLALDQVRYCALLGMMQRDRLTGTDFHKVGGIGNEYVRELQRTCKPFTPAGILDMIEGCSLVFDKLATEWSSEYQVSHPRLVKWIEKARAEISSHSG